jgi:hypothetical protein
VFGNSGIVSLSTSLSMDSIITYDKGETWENIFSNFEYGFPVRCASSYEKSNNEYFLALADSYWNFREINLQNKSLSNISQNIWINNTEPGSRHILREPWSYEVIGKPLDVHKDIAVLTCFEEFIPRIEISTDGLQTFSNVFQLESIFNDFSPDVFIRRYASMNVISKAIDSNTFFSAFSTYTSSPSEQVNFFVKSEDGGNNISEILNHDEYKKAVQQLISISDSGQSIGVLIIQSMANGGKVLFNKSTDGGNTFEYSSGSWVEVYDTNLLHNSFGFPSPGNLIGACCLFQNAELNNFGVVLFDDEFHPIISRSIDGGNNWSQFERLAVPAPASFMTFNVNTYMYGSANDANDMLLAFAIYTGNNGPIFYSGSNVENFTNWKVFGIK